MDSYTSYSSGATWVTFTVDAFAEQEPGECAECRKKLHAGWMNMDCAGEEVCQRCFERMVRSDARCRRADEKYRKEVAGQ